MKEVYGIGSIRRRKEWQKRRKEEVKEGRKICCTMPSYETVPQSRCSEMSGTGCLNTGSVDIESDGVSVSVERRLLLSRY